MPIPERFGRPPENPGGVFLEKSAFIDGLFRGAENFYAPDDIRRAPHIIVFYSTLASMLKESDAQSSDCETFALALLSDITGQPISLPPTVRRPEFSIPDRNGLAYIWEYQRRWNQSLASPRGGAYQERMQKVTEALHKTCADRRSQVGIFPYHSGMWRNEKISPETIASLVASDLLLDPHSRYLSITRQEGSRIDRIHAGVILGVSNKLDPRDVYIAEKTYPGAIPSITKLSDLIFRLRSNAYYNDPLPLTINLLPVPFMQVYANA